MKIETQINFHQEDVVSISFASNATSKDEVKFSELLVFCVFSLRQLFNLGNHPCAVEIAELLNDIGSDGINGNIAPLLANTKLVKLNQYQYNKSFDIKIEYNNEKISNCYLKADGFGFFAKNIHIYTVFGISALFKYFSSKRNKDIDYLRNLSAASIACSEHCQSENFYKNPKMAVALAWLAAVEGKFSHLNKDIQKSANDLSDMSLEEIESLAKKGDVGAQFLLGQIYDFSVNDLAKAVEWYKLAAGQGHPSAQLNLGNCYLNGDGIAEDKTEAAKWFYKAANQGIIDAQYNLGMCYHVGDGVPKNNNEAKKWYEKAAKQGHLLAKQVLGLK